MATDWLTLIISELDNHYRMTGDSTKRLRLEKLRQYAWEFGVRL